MFCCPMSPRAAKVSIPTIHKAQQPVRAKSSCLREWTGNPSPSLARSSKALLAFLFSLGLGDSARGFSFWGVEGYGSSPKTGDSSGMPAAPCGASRAGHSLDPCVRCHARVGGLYSWKIKGV